MWRHLGADFLRKGQQVQRQKQGETEFVCPTLVTVMGTRAPREKTRSDPSLRFRMTSVSAGVDKKRKKEFIEFVVVAVAGGKVEIGAEGRCVKELE